MSFVYAFAGIKRCIISERNFRIHITAAVTVFIFGALYGLNDVRLALLTLTCVLVCALEAVNTAIEAEVDILSPERSELAKTAKDTAAAAVLVSAIGALVVAVVMFSDVSRLLAVFARLFTMPLLVPVLIYLAACVFFVFGVGRKQR